MIRLNCLF